MAFLDWMIIAGYSLGMILLGWMLGRRQKSSEDYYLAGRKLPWLPIGFSTMATQLGAVSFVSAPAFVALRPGGGMIWLGYELALPLSMIMLMAFFFPVYHSLHIISVYEFLEKRFDLKIRVVMSIIFQISRGLATSVAVYAAAIVVSISLNMPLHLTLLVIGAVALIYELFGGIHVDILSDTIQMVIIIAGIIITGMMGLELIGGWSVIPRILDPSRLTAVDFSAHGLGDGKDFGFWPLFLGGFFLYLSYYGCDQSQVQRELSARSTEDCKKSLLFNGFLRFPLVLGYCLLGLVLGAYTVQNPAFLSRISQRSYDYLLPAFILEAMPPGLVGLIFIAILAAAMSSLDSSINSLSAATLEDVYKRIRKSAMTAKIEMRLSKMLTFFWGFFCIGSAFIVKDISPTIIESINKIGSAFYGPVLSVFFAAVFLRSAKPLPVLSGLVCGILLNLFLWVEVPSISWLWWNVLGFLLGVWITLTGSLLFRSKSASPLPVGIPQESRSWKLAHAGLILYTMALLLFLIFLPEILGSG